MGVVVMGVVVMGVTVMGVTVMGVRVRSVPVMVVMMARHRALLTSVWTKSSPLKSSGSSSAFARA